MTEKPTYRYRQCMSHYHVCVGPEGRDYDLFGGYCETEDEAKEKVRRLNEGEDYDAVLGSITDRPRR